MKGRLRWSEEQYAEDAAKRGRWQRGGEIVNTESTSGGVEADTRPVGLTVRERHGASVGGASLGELPRAGVAPGPLTLQRATPDAATRVESGREAVEGSKPSGRMQAKPTPSTPAAPVPPLDAQADRSLAAAQAGTSKYRNRRTDGYASAKEAKRAAQLRLLEQAGKIRNLREQVTYLLIPAYRDADGKTVERAASYIADFQYEEGPMWHPVTEDCKGVRTDAYILKRKLMLMVHGIRVRET